MKDLSYEDVRNILRSLGISLWKNAGSPTDVTAFQNFLKQLGATDNDIVKLLQKRGIEIQSPNTKRDIPGTSLGASDDMSLSRKIQIIASRLTPEQLTQLINTISNDKSTKFESLLTRFS